MMITLFVEEPILQNFVDFINEKQSETNGNIVRRLWHLDRNVTGAEKLVEVSVSYDQYIRLADNE
jgi:hypothetical protein